MSANALLFDIDLGAGDTAVPFDCTPGFGLFFENLTTADAYAQDAGGTIGQYFEGAPIGFGLTDMAAQLFHATGTGTVGFFSSGILDDGASIAGNDGVIGFRYLAGQAGGVLAGFNPTATGGLVNVAGTQSGTAAGLILGNRCQAKAISFDLNTSTGDQSITGLGFSGATAAERTPDAVIFMGCFPYGLPGNWDGTDFMLGATDADLNQFAAATRSLFFSGVGSSMNQVVRASQFDASACILHIGMDTNGEDTTVNQVAAIVSMDDDGFTINLSAAGATVPNGHLMTVIAMAIKVDPGFGSGITVGVGTQSDTFVATGFDPDAIMFVSTQTVDNSQHPECYLNIGACDGILERNAWEGTASGAVGGSGPPSYAYWSTNESIAFRDYSQSLLAAANATLTTGGADLNWYADDSVARLFGFIGFKVKQGCFRGVLRHTFPAAA